MNTPIGRRTFLRQLNCAAVGSSAMLSTLLNLRLANQAAAQGTTPGGKALVCLFLGGGMDSFNFLVPTDPSAHAAYAESRGTNNREGGLALERSTLLPVTGTSLGLHPSCPNLQAMANGTGPFQGRRRLALMANIGTLVQPVTKAQYNAWENGSLISLPVPKALFSHIDQIEQWQTGVPQGMRQLTGWAGRCADLLHSRFNTGQTSMNIAIGGNNIFQVGNSVRQFVITSSGALSFEGGTDGAAGNPYLLKNAGLRSILDQHYANLLTEGFGQLTRESDELQRLFQTHFNAPEAQPDASYDALFPNGNYLSDILRTVFKSIRIRSALGQSRQTFFIDYGGWDHHSDLLTPQANLLQSVDQALGGFQQALERAGLAQDVVTFSCSDFGRTLRSNGRGSDHAWGGNAFAFGGPVRGGQVFGRYPDLTTDGPDDLGRGGRILPTLSTDLYFADLLRWFGVPPGDMEYVLPNIRNFWTPSASTAPLGFLST